MPRTIEAMRILVVEDDTGIALGLKVGLRQRGYAVDVAGCLADAWSALCVEPFDLVLLDLGLPDGDGRSLLQRLRNSTGTASLPDAHTPVLIMTARDAVASRIEGLDSGADDYVTKPFDADELEARMRALLRRATGRAQPLIIRGDLVLNPATRAVQLAGQPVASQASSAPRARAVAHPCFSVCMGGESCGRGLSLP